MSPSFAVTELPSCENKNLGRTSAYPSMRRTSDLVVAVQRHALPSPAAVTSNVPCGENATDLVEADQPSGIASRAGDKINERRGPNIATPTGLTRMQGNRSCQRNFVLTVTGPDRIGIVERVTGLLLERGGTSRRAAWPAWGASSRCSCSWQCRKAVLAASTATWRILAADGYKVTTTPTDRSDAGTRPDWRPYQIEVVGADHEGIIHEVARYLSGQGINIESVDSETTSAPVSGVATLCHESASDCATDVGGSRAGRLGSKRLPIA